MMIAISMTSTRSMVQQLTKRVRIPSASATSRFYHDDKDTSGDKKTALVIGSSGILGSTVSQYLSRGINMNVIGADVLELPNESDWDLDAFIALPHHSERPSLGELTQRLSLALRSVLEGAKIDAIVVASGGYEGDPALGNDAADQGALDYGDSIDRMIQMNLYPAAAAGYIAQQFMTSHKGLMVVMGATVALNPTPGMMGYGLSKAAAHHFVQTFGIATSTSLATTSQRSASQEMRLNYECMEELSVIGILPTMLDTPSNRKDNPTANVASWVKPIDIAKEIGTWVKQPYLRPHSGSLVIPKNDIKLGANFILAR
jgi:dihydropteridine reductase